MKRCPQCGREYEVSMSFCLDDGSRLLYGPRSIHSTDPPSPYKTLSDLGTVAMGPGDTPGAEGLAWEPLHTCGHVDNVNAIAVLPFANMSRDEEAEYLSDGLAEELLNVLSRIQGLRVVGRTSSFSFKGKQTTFAEIGRQLNVSFVLEGSVRMAGNRVRISVQLVNVTDGYHLWSQTYDRTMDDIFAIQDDIANSVIEELRTRLTGEEADPSLSKRVAAEVAVAAKGRAEDPEAHRLMLLGRHTAERWTPQEMARAIGYFEQALQLDPGYAICWVELGNAEYVHSSQGWQNPDEGFARAFDAASNALSIDGRLAAGHALIAKLLITWKLDFRGAEASLRRGLELEPDNVFVLTAATWVFCQLGKFADALYAGRRAISLDPLNGPVLQGIAIAAHSAGLLAEAEAACRRSLEISPQATYKRALLALILLGQGRIKEARILAAEEPEEIWRLWSSAIIENMERRADNAAPLLEGIIAKYGNFASFQIAEIVAVSGDTDKAFECLERCIGQDPGISTILISSFLKPLHKDPRWQPLLAKIGIPKEYCSAG